MALLAKYTTRPMQGPGTRGWVVGLSAYKEGVPLVRRPSGTCREQGSLEQSAKIRSVRSGREPVGSSKKKAGRANFPHQPPV